MLWKLIKIPVLRNPNNLRYFSMSTPSETPAVGQGAPADPLINPKTGKPKTAKELEKERKKAEKLAKFQAKQAKQQQAKKQPAKEPKKQKPKVEVPEWTDPTKPGEKKQLIDLDDPAFKSYNPKNVESSWYDWWVAKGFFEPKFAEDGKPLPNGVFNIAAPPPNVTGALHIGHALTVSIQDTLIRYNRMKGKTVLYLPGFDHAGISTQSVVEKNLWAKEKVTRQDLGREKFVAKVWDWKELYHQKIKSQFQSLGASYDWTREGFTLSPELSKAVVEAFVRLHQKGFIYRENKLVNWCVALRSATSNSEIENLDIEKRTQISIPGYTEKVEFGVITSFAYKLCDSDEKIIVATTRPETIFGDTAVAVHPKDERYKHLHGKFVEHPFLDRKLPIVTDDETVDMEFGTGAVKITPAHDENDYNTGKRHNLPFINIYTEDGLLNENCGEWKGMKRFDARVKVIEALKEKGLYVEQKDNKMVIPKCTRTGDIIEPYLKPQWWVKQAELGKAALAAVENGDIKITPKSSESEYVNWVKSLRDWCISRQLWWGHRIPAWLVKFEDDASNTIDEAERWIVARSYEEALKAAETKFEGKKFVLEQDEDVLDTWFSSGLWPFATLGWPEKTPDLTKFYPTSLLETGWDIIFNWVIRMVLLGIELTGKVPFHEVYCHPLVRDAQGRKMSKSLGNVVDPSDVINGISLEGLHSKLLGGNLDSREVEKAKAGQKESYPNGIGQCGADALRFALCAYTTGGRDINLNILRVEGYRKFCNKMYQATKFALMRLGPDFKPAASEKPTGKESLVERWILNKFNIASKTVSEALDKREFLIATTAVYQFWLNELCDVYIENSKYLILEGTEEQKLSARNTLYTCIEGALKLIHPFMPYVTEELWQRLPKRENDTTESIVIAPYPEYHEYFKFESAEEQYALVLDITKQMRSLLAQYDILRNGQIFIEAQGDLLTLAKDQKDLILSLVKGVEKVEIVESDKDVPEGCAAGSVNAQCTVHILVKGQVDIEEQVTKVSKKLEKAKKSKENTEKLINAKDFTAKASEDVQKATIERFETLKADIETFESTIEILKKLQL